MVQHRVPLSGRFINLDESTGRRESVERQLALTGLSEIVVRFGALRGDGRTASITQSEVGCFRSHAQVIRESGGAGPLLILEDDVALPRPFHRWLRQAIDRAGDDWDVLFLHQIGEFFSLSRLHALLRRKRRLGDIHSDDFDRFELLDAVRWYVSGASAYVVSARGALRLGEALTAQEALGYPLPVDIVYQKLIREGRIVGRVLFPFIAGIDSGFESTIGRRPASAAPVPRPAKPCSVIGVSTTRRSPNSCSSPCVTL